MQSVVKKTDPIDASKIRISKYFSDIALITFVLQQLGPNYHISFSTFGLALTAYVARHKITKTAFQRAFLLCIAVSFSYSFTFIKYGYQDQLLRQFPTIISLFFLITLFRKNISIRPPTSGLVLVISISLCMITFYQLFVDRSLQLPGYLFAKGSNLFSADEQSSAEDLSNILRANGIYSEPSYLGMVLCCLYTMIITGRNRYKAYGALVILITQLLAGSALGIFGTILITLIFVADHPRKYFMIVASIGALAITYALLDPLSGSHELHILNRVTSEDSDASLAVRFFNPFILILENITNYDWFGVPSNFYQHFLYTGIYSGLGDFPGHNGILGMLIQYGLVGLIILISVFSQLKRPIEWCLLLIIASQSGGFLTYDKVLSLVLVILVVRHQVDAQRKLLTMNSPYINRTSVQ